MRKFFQKIYNWWVYPANNKPLAVVCWHHGGRTLMLLEDTREYVVALHCGSVIDVYPCDMTGDIDFDEGPINNVVSWAAGGLTACMDEMGYTLNDTYNMLEA